MGGLFESTNMTGIWWLVAVLATFSVAVTLVVLRELRSLGDEMSWMKTVVDDGSGFDSAMEPSRELENVIHQMCDTLNDFSQTLGRLMASDGNIEDAPNTSEASSYATNPVRPDGPDARKSSPGRKPYFPTENPSSSYDVDPWHSWNGVSGEGRLKDGFPNPFGPGGHDIPGFPYFDPYFETDECSTEDCIYPDDFADFQQYYQNSPPPPPPAGGFGYPGAGFSPNGPGPSELDSLENLFRELFGYETESMSALEEMRFNVFKALNRHLIERQYFVSRNSPNSN